MQDRFVSQIASTESESRSLFSTFKNVRNIVLIGEAGSGKTHLFSTSAAQDGAWVGTARMFLNSHERDFTNRTVYIDAIDEKRSSRGDEAAIDAIVRRLNEIRPRAVRISCRAADWLGEADLVAFRAFFDDNGGFVLLRLEPLSDVEVILILTARGVAAAAAEQFLEMANERGLGALLANPQTLLMLWNVVSKGDWPSSRAELYQRAVLLLLEEHNDVHVRRPGLNYTAQELIPTAGALCAVRLLADVDAITLLERDIDEFVPSYKNISIGAPNQSFAALLRRAFISANRPESVDYVHRTIGEFLAALWLSGALRNGLPIGRLTSLLWIDGRPASELRGLNAWLSVFSAEFSHLFSAADPFGVLVYGDTSSMSDTGKQLLLTHLSALAERDPWFRGESWAAEPLAGLSSPSMVPTFKSLLSSPSESFALKTVVLDALCQRPLAEIESEVEGILVDRSATYVERERCVEVLAKSPTGRARLDRVYEALDSSEDGLRLRTHLLSSFANERMVDRVCSLLRDMANSANERVVLGTLYGIEKGLSGHEAAAVLDNISIEFPVGRQAENAIEVHHAVDSLLIKALANEPGIDGARLSKWLRFRASAYSGGGQDREIAAMLRAAPKIIKSLIESEIQRIDLDNTPWSFINGISEMSLRSVDYGALLQCLTDELANATGARREYLYEAAILTTMLIGPGAANTFDAIYDLAEADGTLVPARDRSCAVVIPNWRKTEVEGRTRSTVNDAARKAKNRDDFDAHLEQIASAKHEGWLSFIAKVYFCLFADLDRNASPHQRLESELGPERTRVAVKALIQFVQDRRTTELDKVVVMGVGKGTYFPWWYAVMAGLDEYSAAGEDVLGLGHEYLKSALAIDELHPTFKHAGNVTSEIRHQWRQHVLTGMPAIACEAYAALASTALEKGKDHVAGLHKLINLDELKWVSRPFVLDLISRFPTNPRIQLLDCAELLMKSGAGAEIVALLPKALPLAKSKGAENYGRWLALAFLLARAEFSPRLSSLTAQELTEFVWALGDLKPWRWSSPAPLFRIEDAEFLIATAAGLFPNVSHPPGGWGGTRNAWDGSELVRNVISHLASQPERAAAIALQRLAALPALDSYRDYLKHAIAQQTVRQIDAVYTPPQWAAVVSVLRNGPPANVSDLHSVVLVGLAEATCSIASSNLDTYKRFWNEDSHGKITTPKNEESCRDALLEIVRPRLLLRDVLVEPEGHMANDKRADIVALYKGLKVVVELKRDYHSELWTAPSEQLVRLYARDPQAGGYGVFGVFWFGAKRPAKISSNPFGVPSPKTHQELFALLNRQVQSLGPGSAEKIAIVIFDVSGDY